MKKLLIVSFLVLSSLFVSAQPPRPQGNTYLPNQFRDFVDHQAKWEKPLIERKDGKVIIVMSEERFRALRHMRMMKSQRMRHVNFKQSPPCERCVRKHRHHKL